MADYKAWLSDLSAWLKDIKDHEVKDAVTRFVESEQALKNLGEEKYQLYRNYLKRDIAHLSENDSHYNSLAWQELKESLWFELSHITIVGLFFNERLIHSSVSFILMYPLI